MRGVAFLAARHFLLVDYETGEELWRIPWKTAYDINASDPVFSENFLFVSSGYRTGGILFRLHEEQGTPIWKSRVMRNQCNSSVLWKGYLYGFDGNMAGSRGSGGSLKCVHFKTGEEKWSADGLGVGSLMLADSKLIILSEGGKLLIAEAAPEEFRVLAQGQILQGKCWTVPVLSHGVIYARNAAGDLVCIDARFTAR
jgi:outer membrane protein assembly factor BamB